MNIIDVFIGRSVRPYRFHNLYLWCDFKHYDWKKNIVLVALQCLHDNFNLLQISRALQEEYPKMRGLCGGWLLKKAAGEMIISLCNYLLLFSNASSSNTNIMLH